MLAEHQIALTQSLRAPEGESDTRDSVGIISTGLCVKESIERCAQYLRRRQRDIDADGLGGALSDADWSEVVVDGHVDTKLAYIREHLE